MVHPQQQMNRHHRPHHQLFRHQSPRAQYSRLPRLNHSPSLQHQNNNSNYLNHSPNFNHSQTLDHTYQYTYPQKQNFHQYSGNQTQSVGHQTQSVGHQTQSVGHQTVPLNHNSSPLSSPLSHTNSSPEKKTLGKLTHFDLSQFDNKPSLFEPSKTSQNSQISPSPFSPNKSDPFTPNKFNHFDQKPTNPNFTAQNSNSNSFRSPPPSNSNIYRPQTFQSTSQATNTQQQQPRNQIQQPQQQINIINKSRPQSIVYVSGSTGNIKFTPPSSLRFPSNINNNNGQQPTQLYFAVSGSAPIVNNDQASLQAKIIKVNGAQGRTPQEIKPAAPRKFKTTF